MVKENTPSSSVETLRSYSFRSTSWIKFEYDQINLSSVTIGAKRGCTNDSDANLEVYPRTHEATPARERR